MDQTEYDAICLVTSIAGIMALGGVYGISLMRRLSRNSLIKARELYSNNKIGEAYKKAYSILPGADDIPFSNPRKVVVEARSLMKKIEDQYLDTIDKEVESFKTNISIKHEFYLHYDNCNFSCERYKNLSEVSPTYKKLFC